MPSDDIFIKKMSNYGAVAKEQILGSGKTKVNGKFTTDTESTVARNNKQMTAEMEQSHWLSDVIIESRYRPEIFEFYSFAFCNILNKKAR